MDYDVVMAEELVRLAERRWKAKRVFLRSEEGRVLLEWMEEVFETGLPCFQGGRGGFDALDAMRRDAYREVLLWLRRLPKQEDEGLEDV